ncbi:hypothetical protein IP90_01553 [Luteimonas cucumeris]|uniref:YfdX protein n=1 Tax=Luteimonas cucumeris TaxID=985012 RepID=A0A562L7Y5_9GAMM|nr:hypothetical protein [Luteimonas cucumeris]TWI03738.1 hypothetical protein IP90_01553 [Luteimonas cucumeris]
MNRKLHNTFSALSVTGVLMMAGLIAATPVPHNDPVVAQQIATVADGNAKTFAGRAAGSQASDAAAKAAERTVARTQAIEAKAEALAARIDRSANLGELLGHVAGFTAEVTTEAALTAAVDELSRIEFNSGSTTEIRLPSPAPTSKPRRSRPSLAMPYFSFANRG